MPIRFKLSKLWTNLEKLCTFRKTNVCSCHLAFFTICIYRGAMGMLLTGHRVSTERPGLSRLARPRPRLRQAKAPSHRVDKAKDAHRPRPDPRCLVSSHQRPRMPPTPQVATNICPMSCLIQTIMRAQKTQYPFLSLGIFYNMYI